MLVSPAQGISVPCLGLGSEHLITRSKYLLVSVTPCLEQMTQRTSAAQCAESASAASDGASGGGGGRRQHAAAAAACAALRSKRRREEGEEKKRTFSLYYIMCTCSYSLLRTTTSNTMSLLPAHHV